MNRISTPSCFELAIVSLSVSSISIEEYTSKLEGFIASAKDRSARLVLFPEFAIAPILEEMNGDCCKATNLLEQALKNMAVKYDVYICGGSGHYEIDGKIYNQSFLINNVGDIVYQPKINLIEIEKAAGTTGGYECKIISTPFVKLAICVCYDIEFPELVRHLVLKDVDLILNPSYTKDKYGEYRIQYCAQARAVENHIYVAKSCLVGKDGYELTKTGCGRSALYAPIDLGFPENGIIDQTLSDVEGVLITQVDLIKLNTLRQNSSTSPLNDYNNLELNSIDIQAVLL